MITYTHPDDEDTAELTPITPAMLAAMDAEIPITSPSDDLLIWIDGLLIPHVPSAETRLGLATRITLRFRGTVDGLENEIASLRGLVRTMEGARDAALRAARVVEVRS